MSLASRKTTVSRVSPEPPLLSLGWMDRMVSRISLAVLLWKLGGGRLLLQASSTAAELWCCGSRDVCIGVQAEDLGSVHEGQVLNGLAHLINVLGLGNAVRLVEHKRLCKHVVPKPHLGAADGQQGVCMCACVCVYACMRACVRACVRTCVRVCVCV